MVVIPSLKDETELKEKQENNLIVSKETFMSLVRTKIFPNLAPHEQERIKTKKKFYLLIVLALILTSITIHYGYLKGYLHISQLDKNDYWPLILAAFLGPFILGIHQNKLFLDERKELFLDEILSYIGKFRKGQETVDGDFLNESGMFPSVVFQKESLPKNAFKLTGYDSKSSSPLSIKNFFTKHFFSGKKNCPVFIEENFTGHYKSTKFSVVETLLAYKEGKSHRTLFKGILIAIPLQKEILSQTVAYNESFTLKHLLTDFEKVELEDEEFMTEYNIYATSQIEPRFILKPIFIERLKKLKQVFNTKKIDFAIFNNHILLFVHINKNLFEPFSVFKSLYNSTVFEKFYDEIESICHLIDTLEIDNEKERLNLFNSHYKMK
ncbi:MAG: DUF3137 domain-containing protein [Alphaproteobacteria bacterium]|nr:DUF3137 domain-containing protein [Alphaproteobacteria bacterium]